MNPPPAEQSDQPAGPQPGHGEDASPADRKPRRLPDPTTPAVLATIAGLGSMLLVAFLFIRVYSSWDAPEPAGEVPVSIPQSPVRIPSTQNATEPAMK